MSLTNDFEVDLFERSKRLGNLSFATGLDECFPMPRPGFRGRKDCEIERLIAHHPVVQLSEHFVQNWPLGFAEDAVPELVVTFKVIRRWRELFASPGHKHGQSRPGRDGDKLVLARDRDKSQPKFGDIQDLFPGQRLYHRSASIGVNDAAFCAG
jgi:hypothetical protein